MKQVTSYISLPTPCRTPDRLATIALLHGLTPADIDKAKVLDIGCGQGWDIISLAYTYPNAQFIGIDFSIDAIEEGRKTIKELNLSNIKFECSDIAHYSTEEKFDYIFCHGVYTWVSEELSHHILELCHNLLSEKGLAYISYNALPAWGTRSVLREALRHFTSSVKEEEKVEKARETISFMLSALQNYPTPYSMSLQLELKNALKSSDGFIAQELLADEAHAEYLHTFISKAKQHHLIYIGEAKFERMVSNRLDEISDAQELSSAINAMSSFEDQEQALDFLFPTWLRQGVLHKENASKKELTELEKNNLLKNLYISSPLVPSDPRDSEGGEDVFMSPTGSHVQITSRYIRHALRTLNMTWPAYTKITDLYDTLTNRPCYAFSDFAKELLILFQKGQIELHIAPEKFSSILGEKPKVSQLAVLQAKTQDWVTSLKQEYTLLTDFEKSLLPFLDGEHTKDDLITAIKNLIDNQDLNIKDEFKSEANEAELKDVISDGIDEALHHLYESALIQ